jgi:hypothetical protein
MLYDEPKKLPRFILARQLCLPSPLAGTLRGPGGFQK